MQFHLPVYDKKGPVTVAISVEAQARSYQTFKRPYETGAAGADRRYCRTAGKPEKRDFFPFSDAFPQREPLFFTELAELALDQRKL